MLETFELENEQTDFSLTVNCELPNKCPHCGALMTPAYIDDILEGSDEISLTMCKAIFLLRCSSCYEYFLAAYSLDNNPYSTNPTGTLINYSFRPPIEINLPEELKAISPNFFEVYGQATVAETEKLDQIAGIGYRKSIEFLIKDFLIKEYPEKEEEIKEEFLGKSIKRIENKKIKNLIEGATWIGNDEAHYVRRHEDKDISHMKRFIKTAAFYIASEFVAEEAEEFVASTSNSK